MKKLISLILAVGIIFCACACGKTAEPDALAEKTDDTENLEPDCYCDEYDSPDEDAPALSPVKDEKTDDKREETADVPPGEKPEENPGEKPAKKPEPVSAAPVFPQSAGLDDYEGLLKTRGENAGRKEFLNAVTEFTRDSAKRVLSENENGCYSPLSLYIALALCAAGSAGETREEMLSVLRARSAPELAKDCESLIKRLYADTEDYKITTANALFIDDDASVKDGYVKTATESFYAFLKTVDFADTQKATEEIKSFIKEHTAGKLEYQGEPDKSTRIDIINTLYFLSRWSDPFHEFSTRKETFHAPSGDVETDFMHKGAYRTSYFEGDGFLRLSLPFADGSRMVLVLPVAGRTRAVLDMGEAAFSGGTEKKARVILALPKFKIKNVWKLEDILMDMGIKKAFADADFSEMSEESLCISSVTQGTYIAVDEKGAEAAAYTEIAMKATAAFDPEEPVEIRFDRPFIYEIQAFDGTPLFTGVCADPAK